MHEKKVVLHADRRARAIYYSSTEQYVGIAGKPDSVNDLNVFKSSGGGHANTKLAGIREWSVTYCTSTRFLIPLLTASTRANAAYET